MGTRPPSLSGREPSLERTRSSARAGACGAEGASHRRTVVDASVVIPTYKTRHRRLQQWRSGAVIREALVDLANELHDVGVLDEREAFIDATFVLVRGGAEVGLTKVGKGIKSMAIVDCHGCHGLPLAVSTHAANHREVHLEQLCFDFLVEAKPHDLIGDRACGSDKLDAALGEQDVEMIAPHWKNRLNRRRRTDEGCDIFCWVVERFFARIGNKRHRVPIWREFYPKNFPNFGQLACVAILLKYF